jgi:hypothetical protein
MGHEIKGRRATEDQNWDAYAVYRTIVVVDGEVLGGIYTEMDQAFEIAAIILQGIGRGSEKDIKEFTHSELRDALADHERVSYSEVAEREVLYA